MPKLRGFLIILPLVLGATARADVFDGPMPECYEVTKVIDGKIYFLNRDSGTREEVLDVSPSNSRRDQIILKAQEAASGKKQLCGSVRGISTKDLDAGPAQELSGKNLENFCWDKKEEFKNSKGWVGLLNTKQYNEVEDFQAKCMVTKGKSVSSSEPQENKIDRYYACKDAASKAQNECQSSSDQQSCIKNFLAKKKEAFKDQSDFAIFQGASGGKFTVQCRINGRAPSRRELDAPTRTSPDEIDSGAGAVAR